MPSQTRRLPRLVVGIRPSGRVPARRGAALVSQSMRTQFGTSFEKPKVERRAPIASESLDRVARKSELDLVPRCGPRNTRSKRAVRLIPEYTSVNDRVQ